MEDQSWRKNTICGAFQPESPQARALQVHNFLFNELKLHFHELITIELEPGVKKFYFKLNDQQRFRQILDLGSARFVHDDGETSQVLLTDAGSPGYRVLRLFRLPLELPDADVTAALAPYGRVIEVAYEKWVNYQGKGLLNGIRDVKIELQKNVPSYLKIRGVEALILYDGQPKTCRKCGQEGHLFFEKELCPARPAGRRWEEEAKRKEEEKRKKAEEEKRNEDEKNRKEEELKRKAEEQKQKEKQRKAKEEQQRKEEERRRAEKEERKQAAQKQKEEQERKAKETASKQPSSGADAKLAGARTADDAEGSSRKRRTTPPAEQKSSKEARADDSATAGADDAEPRAEQGLTGQQQLEMDMIVIDLEGMHGALSDTQCEAVMTEVKNGMTATQYRRRLEKGLEPGDPILSFADDWSMS